MSGYDIDTRPDHQTKVVDALFVKMRDNSLKWNKSAAGELFTSTPGLVVLLTSTDAEGNSKLMIRLAGASKHSEIPLGAEEDEELRGKILKTDPQEMDGDEWICSQAELILSV